MPLARLSEFLNLCLSVFLVVVCILSCEEIFRLSCLFACRDKGMLLDPEPSSVAVMHVFSVSRGAVFLFPPTLIDVPDVFGYRCQPSVCVGVCISVGPSSVLGRRLGCLPLPRWP